MRRTKEEFLNSSFAQVVKMIDMYIDELQMQTAAAKNEEYNPKYFGPTTEIRDIQSMKEIEGWW